MPPDGRPYRGALFGSGGVARLGHLPAYLGADSRLQIGAVVDGAEDVPDIDGLPRLYHRGQLDELGPFDFIDICTPTSSHLDLTLWGLANGYHVLCEKPVALTRGEAERIARAARAAGRVVVPCHQYRFNPAWLKLREWLEAGHIGRWQRAEFRVYRAHADRGSAPGGTVPWRGTRSASRGGVLLDHGTHLIYLLLDVAGGLASIQAWTGRLRHFDYDVEDTARILLEYQDRHAVIFTTWAADRRENHIRFAGERGTIEWLNGELILDSHDVKERIDFTAALDKASYKDWFARLFVGFAEAMDRGDCEHHLEEITEVARVLEEAYQAAREVRA